MKETEIWEKYTDFISDRQEILLWEFDSAILQSAYNTYTYSLPVEIELFRALKKISESKNKSVREKKFTIFLGDCGSQFELFAIGVSAKINSRISEIITGCLEDIHGYETIEYGQIPYVPLIPKYRYDCGNVYEYTSETRKVGKFRKDDAVIAGLKLQYRIYESAEGIITMGRCYSK